VSDIGGLFITFKFFPQIVWVDDKEGILLGCNQTKSMAMATERRSYGLFRKKHH